LGVRLWASLGECLDLNEVEQVGGDPEVV
jgi:hypothetical protein